MHVAVDCRSVHPRMGGIGRAALELVQAMGESPRGHQITMIVAGGQVGGLRVKGVRLLPVDGAMIDERFEQLHLPSILEELAPDVYLNTTFSVPAVKTTRVQSSIVHDVVFEDRPDLVEPRLCEYLSRWTRFAAERSDHVITVSDHALGRIRQVYGVEPSRITRVYNGVSGTSFDPPSGEEIVRVRKKYTLGKPFLLYLGTVEVKKGIPELLAAYRKACDSGLALDLVLAGSGGGQDPELKRRTREYGLEGHVHALGFIDEADKKSLLQSASLFVYPSLYEGFGLPPLEAMALGVPTLVSDRTSLPEVVGEAAMVAPVHDLDAFAKALSRGVEDETFRRAAASAGPARARSFTWRRAADEILDLFERLGRN